MNRKIYVKIAKTAAEKAKAGVPHHEIAWEAFDEMVDSVNLALADDTDKTAREAVQAVTTALDDLAITY